ncbi:MAG: Vacuolar protein sorting-associated protein 62 [Solirubrobacteraceae bacterium]|nr:Vacuolar protein sorting-associated protein 62 [Solirubrobacteraceae bacterium]
MAGDPAGLAQRFRPTYRLHSEEMWYPCHPEDQLRCADLVSTADGSIVIPALGEAAGSPADQLLCTPLGLTQLAARGIELEQSTVDSLRWHATSSPHYGWLTSSAAYVLARADDRFMAPYGWIGSESFDPPGATWFHRGAPNNPLGWLGGDPSTYASQVLDPPAGTSRGAWQEPTTVAWVQEHSVEGVAYVDVIYTVMLAWNGSISLLAGQAEHPNDVETTVVRLAAADLDHPVRYMFQQHGGYAWYEPGAVELDGERVVVYLARESHECYPHAGRSVRIYGVADDLCDADGVTWDAPVQYAYRPQGVDGYGEDTDALRCSLAPGDPSSVVLVPLDDPGPLWQYVRFSFLGRRPPAEPLSDDDFLFQPFPLHTTKWWPGEGPAASSGPLSQVAAEASAPGVPPGFFADVAPYLGPDPLPGCGGAPAVRAADPAPAPAATSRPPYEPSVQDTVLGKDVGGGAASLAPDAPFVDWRGGIGSYLLGSINAHMPTWVQELPDPLTLTGIVVGGGLTIETLSVHGFSTLVVAPVTAVSATGLHVHGSSADIACAATISYQGGAAQPMSADLDAVTIDSAAQMVTPVAVPGQDPAQWYVPYVGPLPYSYATAPYATTSLISHASIATTALVIGTITVDVGNPTEDWLLDLLLAAFKSTLEGDVATALESEVNALLTSVYSGARRVA